MKKITIIILLLGSITLGYGQDMAFVDETQDNSFEIEVWNLNIWVPKGSLPQQCWYIAYRSVNPQYNQSFDSLFFVKGVTYLQKKYADKSVDKLKNWGSLFQKKNSYISATELNSFKANSEYYNLPISITSLENYDIWKIGNVQFQVIKKTCKIKGKKKIALEDGYYYLQLM